MSRDRGSIIRLNARGCACFSSADFLHTTGIQDFRTFTLPQTFTGLEWVWFWTEGIDRDQFAHFFLDDIQVTSVPEPSQGVLAAAAVGSIAGLARRRRRARRTQAERSSAASRARVPN
jgi:hypothetical protein